MELMPDMEFSKLPWDKKVEYIDARLGDHPERIRTPHDLLPLAGQTIYLVLSPFARDVSVSNCFLLTWEVGKVGDHYGIPVTEDRVITHANDERYVCWHATDVANILSLKDFNIVPNNYNNHAAFKTLDAARAYILYRSVSFEEDQSIASLNAKEYDFFFKQEDADRLIATEQEARRRIKEQEEAEAKKNGQ